MVWIQVRPKMTLKEEGSSIVVKGTKAITSLGNIGNMILLSEVVWVPLKPTEIMS